MLLIFVLAGLLAVVATPARAASPYPATELFPVAPGVNAERGFSVAVEGDWMAMGAPREDVVDEGDDRKREAAGAVYLFRWSGAAWELKAQLAAVPPRENAQLGFALALHQGVLAAGAPGEGRVHLFRESGGVWSPEAQLPSSGPIPHFGRSLALDGGRLAVGAVDGHGDTDGVVHLYLDRAGTWTFERRVFPRPPQTGERFGAAVALAGDVLAVGAPGYNLPGGAPDAGAVHVFRRENGRWLPQAKLSSPADPYRAGQQLGFAVATDGSQIFAGAPTAEPEGPRLVSSGAVYRFTLRAGAWGPGELLAVSSLAAGDQLGFSLSLSGDLLVAGAPAPPPGRGSGGIRVFRRSGGSWEALAPSPAAPANAERRDLAGFAVAVSGERVAVGAVLGDQADGAAGASWSFHCSEEGDACREESEAVARDPDAGTLFGAAMALTDEHLAVGEPDAGAAYLYRKAGLGWRQEKRLLSGSAADGFGSAVALAGGLLAVGAPRGRAGGVSGEPAGYPGGSVDFYSRDGGSWAYKGLFYPDPPIPERPFGVAAAFEGDRVAIGAPGLDVPSAVFLFEKGDRGWGLAGTFPLAPGGGFGAAVSLRGGNLAIGAPETGAVYVVARGEHGWPQPEPRGLQPIAPRLPGTGLGASVVLGDGVLAAGAPDTEGGSGAVHLYESSKGAWQGGRLSAPPGAASRLGASLALLESRLAVGAPDPEGTGRAFLYDLGRKAWEEEPLLPLAPRVCGGFGDAVALSKDFVVVASPDPSCGDRVTVFALPPEGGEDP